MNTKNKVQCFILVKYYRATDNNNFMRSIEQESIEALNHKALLNYELSNLYENVKQHPIPRRKSDPVSTQIFIHNFQQKLVLPSIIMSTRSNINYQMKSKSTEKRNRTQKKGKRFQTLPSDIECNRKFPIEEQTRKIVTSRQESSSRKQFIEIDMLRLMTWYAKNDLNKENPDAEQSKKKFLMKDEIKQIAIIPTKPQIPTFIQNYKVVNETINVDDLVRSIHFGANYKQKEYLYFGQLKKGAMDGKGVMVTLTWVFQGTWASSKRIEGLQITPKGIYKGKFVNDERSKVGQFFWNNGEYYSGEWHKNKKHGTGVWKSAKGDIYMGQWVKGKVNGYGSHLTKNGQKYQGYFANFLKHGQGKEHFPNGDFFEGIFKQGKPHGFGKYKWRNGITYEGQFSQGYRSGKGIIKKLGIEYEGSFLKEKAEGQGRLAVINGDNFEGKFKRGKKQGKGIYRESKCIYIGAWKNNKFIQNQI